MKDGVVAESGTHDELIKRGGEYSKLYDIEANAFRVDTASDVRPFPLDSVLG
jgi:predicted nucleic-acid-binding Zn-ribbon protein